MTTRFMFWGNRRLLPGHDRGVRRALATRELRDLPVLGRGACSVVMGAGDSVFKLTIDTSAYALAARQMLWRCSALPRVLALHGIVGESDLGQPIHLMEIERLERLSVGSDARKCCLRLAAKAQCLGDTAADTSKRLKRAVMERPASGLHDGIDLLATFIEEREPAIAWDLHVGNFMQRADSGEIVVTDPFLDIDMRSRVLAKHAERLGGDLVII